MITETDYEFVKGTTRGTYQLDKNRFPMTCDTIAYMKGNTAISHTEYMGTPDWKYHYDEIFRKTLLSVPGVEKIEDVFANEEKTKLFMVLIHKKTSANWNVIVPLIENAMKDFEFFDQPDEKIALPAKAA